MANGKKTIRNPQPRAKTTARAKGPQVKENELGDGAVSGSGSFMDSGSDLLQDTCQAEAAHSQIPMQHGHLTSEKSTYQDGGKDSFQTDAQSKSSLKAKNDSTQKSLRVTLQNCTTTHHLLKTPDNPITVDEIVSSNTVNELRSIRLLKRALLSNGLPSPPVKRYRKGATPKKRDPQSKTLNVCKGDNHGIACKTNALVDDEKCTPRNRGQRTYNRNCSKSLYNPKSDEIAARLKLNERVDELLRKSPNKETVMTMSEPCSSRSLAFSLLPSTSKDNENILKNEKHFSDSLSFDANDYDIGDDEELPNLLPKTLVIDDIDKTLAELDAFKEKKGKKMRKNVVTVVDLSTLESNRREQVISIDLVTPKKSLSQTETGGALKGVSSPSTTVIEIPDTIEPIVDLCNHVATSKANPAYFCNDDVQFVSEAFPSGVMNGESRINKLGMQSNSKENTTAGSNSDMEVVQNDCACSHIDTVNNLRDVSRFSVLDDQQKVLIFITNSCSRDMEPLPQPRRRRNSNTPKPTPACTTDVTGVNNENAAPSTYGQETPTNSKLGLGDCPICMESLSKNPIASTTCGHVFCLECIRRCLAKTGGRRCPTCRKSLRGTGYHQVFL